MDADTSKTPQNYAQGVLKLIKSKDEDTSSKIYGNETATQKNNFMTKSSVNIKKSLNNGTLPKVNENRSEDDSSDELANLTEAEYIQMRKTGALGPNNERNYKKQDKKEGAKSALTKTNNAGKNLQG